MTEFENVDEHANVADDANVKYCTSDKTPNEKDGETNSTNPSHDATTTTTKDTSSLHLHPRTSNISYSTSTSTSTSTITAKLNPRFKMEEYQYQKRDHHDS